MNQTEQSIPHVFFYFVQKEMTQKPLTLAAAKGLSFSLHAIGTTCFNECFLFHMITRRHYFL